MEYQSIRRYKKQRKPGKLNDMWMLLLIVIVLVIVGLFGMSLFKVGLFKDRPTTSDTEETSGNVSESETAVTTVEEETTADEKIPPISFKNVTVSSDEVHRGLLVLIDADHPYVFPNDITFMDNTVSASIEYDTLENKDKLIVSIYNTRKIYVDGYGVASAYVMLRLDVIEKVSEFLKAFSVKNNDNSALITGGYRSYSSQADLAEKNEGAAKPGCSDFHTGTTFTVQKYAGGVQSDLLSAAHGGWLKSNMCNYGFIMRYPSYAQEKTGYNIPSQLRYVGNVSATFIMNSGICLEEYLELLRTEFNTPDSPLLVSCNDGWDYVVYYTPVTEEGDVTLSVPSELEYTISGDNIGGIIVTAKVRERKQ